MTHLSRAKTKTAMKKRFKEGKPIFLSDPAIINPISGNLTDIMKEREEITICGPYPLRKWYSRVTKHPKTGKIVIH